MPDYWRFTRNQYTRRIYDALKALGVTATRMNEYRAELEQTKLTRSPPLPAGIALDFVSAAEADSLDVDFDFSLPVNMLDGEWAVLATVDERPVGRTLVTDTPKPYVDPLEREVPVPGVYIRRVFVVPERRGQGIASATLRAAVTFARDEFGADTATALIAADNGPSRRLFESCEFERVGTHEYARVGPFSAYRHRGD